MYARTVASRAIGSIVLAMCLPLLAGAQSASSSQSRLPSGTRIRFEMRNGARHEGRLVALSPDTLRATWLGATETAIPVSEVQKLEVMSGRRRRVTRSLLIGTGVGAALGTVAGAMTYKPCETTEFLGCFMEPKSRGESAALGALLAGVTGLVVGGVVGLVPRDRWERVRLDGGVVQFRTRALPHGAQGLEVAVSF